MAKLKKQFKKKLNNDRLDAEFRKARLDVFKFGVKHLNQKDKEATKIDQLVRLGAHPKKERYVNYRKMMLDKKNAKVKDLTSDVTLKKHLAVELKKQIDVARSKYDKKHANKKKSEVKSVKKKRN